MLTLKEIDMIEDMIYDLQGYRQNDDYVHADDICTDEMSQITIKLEEMRRKIEDDQN